MGNFFLYQWGQWITCAVPIRVAYGLACILASLQCRFSTQDRLAVEQNLRAALNREPTYQETREVFHHFAKYLVDFFTMTRRVNRDFINEHIEIKGLDVLNKVLAKGKGGVLVSAHLGNWEMGGAVLPLLGFPISEVALPHQDPRVNDFFNAQREAFGCAVIQTNVAVRRVIEHLRMNKLVAILAERDFGQHGIRMPFLNKQAMIPKGAAVFSLKTGAPIIPAFFLREGDQSFKIFFEEPIYPSLTTGEKISDDILKEYIHKYLSIIERYTRQYPTQWLMFRDFTTS